MEIKASVVKELRDITGAGMLDCKNALVHCEGNMDNAIDYLREKGVSKAAKKADRIAAEGLSNIFTKNNTAVILEVNSETDFVAKNVEFQELVSKIGEILLNNNVNTIEEANEASDGTNTINELIVNNTAKIGEKLSFRRFEKITKQDDQIFGSYLHMGGKISSLIVIDGDNENVAKDIAMQAAAMKPSYAFISDVPESVIDHEKEVLKEQAVNEGKDPEIAEKMVIGRLKKFYKEIVLNEQDFVKNGDLTISSYLKENNSKLISMVRYEVGEGMEKRNDNFAEEVMSQINN